MSKIIAHCPRECPVGSGTIWDDCGHAGSGLSLLTSVHCAADGRSAIAAYVDVVKATTAGDDATAVTVGKKS